MRPGERVRVVLGRTLLAGSDVLVCDEPTSGLDAGSIVSVVDAIHDSHRRLTLVVTHDYEAFAAFPDRILFLDPTRREILVLLRDRGVQTAGEIAARFRSVSRPGISRHLRVLRECALVTSFRSGKSQNYVLDARPLAAIRDGWLAGFADMQTESLSALRKQVKSKRRPRRTPTQRKSR